MAEDRELYIQLIRNHLRTAYLLPEEKITDHLPRFLETIKNLLVQLEDQAIVDDDEALSRTGHAMKGALLNLGLSQLAEKAYAIEKHSDCATPERGRWELINDLKREVETFI